MENEIIWTLGVAALALAAIIVAIGTYLNNLAATTVREEWSEAGLARHIRSLHRLIFVGLATTALAGLLAGGFISANSFSWGDDSLSSARNTVNPPEWICRE